MLLKDIPYFVKFTFSCDEDSKGFTTTDSEMLQYFVSPTSDEPLTKFKIGQKIKIVHDSGTNESTTYIIKNISIQQLYDDTEMHKRGLDSEDAQGFSGEYKEWLFKIYIEMDKVK